MIALAVAAAFASIYLVPGWYQIVHRSEACQTHAEQPHQQSHSLTSERQESGPYKLHYRTSEQEQGEACVWGHTAEEWIALLTAHLVAFTAGLAAFTALLWWATYGLWRDSEDSERRLERAYLFAGIGEDFEELDVFTTRLMVVAKNYGKTPAFIKEAYYRVMPVPERLDPEPTFPDAPEREAQSEADVVHAFTDIAVGATEPRNVGGARIDHKRYIVYGYIRYGDIFGASHESRFCMEVLGELLRKGTGSPPRLHAEVRGGEAWNKWT